MALRDGQFPSMEEVASGLRGDAPVPKEVREFLADFITGKTKRPPGRQPDNRIDRDAIRREVRITYDELLDEEGGPSNRLIELTRKKLGKVLNFS